MKYIWNKIEDKNWKAATKYRAFLWVLVIISGAIGLILWGGCSDMDIKNTRLDGLFCRISSDYILVCRAAL